MTNPITNPSVLITKNQLNQIDSALAEATRAIPTGYAPIRESIGDAQRMIRGLHDQAIEVMQAANAAVKPVPSAEEYDPKITLTRTVTTTVDQTLVVHARELGLDWGLVTQAHALNEHLGAGDRARDAAFEAVEDRVFFAAKFEDRLVETALNAQVDDAVRIEIEE